MEQLDAVTIVNYDAKTHWLTVKDANNQPRVIILDDKTKLESSNGTTLDKVEPLLEQDARSAYRLLAPVHFHWKWYIKLKVKSAALTQPRK